MAKGALFIGWGPVIPGREQKSGQVFQEAVQSWSGLQQQGVIDGFETYFLDPHGGDLAGFALLHGDEEKLNQLRSNDDFVRMNLRAALVIQSLGVVGAVTGDTLNQQFGVYQQQAAELA